MDRNFSEFKRKALFLAGLGLAILFVLRQPNLLILCFAGVLMATVLAGMADWLSGRLGIRFGLGLSLALLGAVLLFAGLAAMVGVPFVSQVDDLGRTLKSAYHSLSGQLEQSNFFQQLTEEFSADHEWIRRNLPSRIFGLFSGMLGALSSLVLILFIALYLSINPGLYFRGLLFLFPKPKRTFYEETFRILATSLRYWMFGRLLSMSVVGLLTGLGLWIVDIPLVLSLAVIAALLAFIPVIGPIVSAVPGVLLGFSQSATTGLLVFLVYSLVQIIESYLITPIIDKRVVALPPVLLLASQAFFGSWVGAAGVIFAAPLTLVAVILVQRHYVQQELGYTVETIGKPP